MARVIVVTSGKGGVGKTTVTALVGRELAKNGKKVVLIDADLGLKNLDTVLGLESRVIYDLEDVVKGRATLRQALVQDKYVPTLFLLPAWMRINATDIDENYMNAIINSLQNEYDFILIDSPAGIEKGFFNAIRNAKEAIVVLTLDKTSLRDADKVVGLLKNNQITDIKLIVNKNSNSKTQLTIEDVKRIMDVPLIGVLKDDKEVQGLQNYGTLISNNSDLDVEIKNITNKLLGKEEIVSKKSPLARFIKSVLKS
ncbi:MAG: septum site-determining protein MinD [Erysipelotrichales bacterium]|nr:septum site-determining protein MinD [Erysipelotrichales bacterium]